MAKQVINIGSAELAGDGETLRSALNKVNLNFTELYDDDANDITLASFAVGPAQPASLQGAIAYNNATGIFTYTPPVIPTTLLNLGITDGTAGQQLVTDGSGGFTFQTYTETGTLVDETTPKLGGDLDTNGNKITFADSANAEFGDNGDLKIFHNGGHSIVRETGTGSLYLQSDNNVILSTDSSTKIMVKGIANGSTELYHNGIFKFKTGSHGVDVVDEVHTEGATPHLTLKRTDNDNVPTIRFKGQGGTIGASIDFDGTLGTTNELAFQVYDGATIAERFRVTYTGATVSGDLVITGDLTINGTTTTINTTELQISDNIMTLNSDVTGAPSENAGIEVERGSSDNVDIRWNETSDQWEFTNDGTTYTALGTGAGGLANVVEDTTPQLGGDLDVGGNSIVSTSSGPINIAPDGTGKISLSGVTQLGGNIEGQTYDITTTGKILYSNVYSNLVDLPSATTYHGMFAHVHATGKGYFAHGGNWVELANMSDVPSGGLANVIEDTTPQLGGDLDCQGFNITMDNGIISTSAGNLQLSSFNYVTIDSANDGQIEIGRSSGTGNVIIGKESNGTSVSFEGAASFDEQVLLYKGAEEKYSALTGATGTVVHDCDNGKMFYHTTPAADWTANFTNLNLNQFKFSTSVGIVVAQGGTAYIPNAVEIAGVAQTIIWQGNSTPTGTANGTDAVSFTIMRDNTTYIVLGQLTSFGGV